MSLTLVKPGDTKVVLDAISSKPILTLYDVGSATTGNYQTLKKMGTNAAYQVTAGKTLYLFSFMSLGSGSNTGATEMGYGDTAVTNSGSAPTNNVPVVAFIGGPTAFVATVIPIFWAIPAQKYVYMKQSAGGCSMQLLGFEE